MFVSVFFKAVILAIFSVCLALPASAGGGAEVGNGRHGRSRQMPRSEMPKDEQKGGQEKGEPGQDQPKPDEDKKNDGKQDEPKTPVPQPELKVTSARLSTTQIKEGDSLEVVAIVENTGSRVFERCAGALFSAEMAKGGLAFDSCQLRDVGSAKLELTLQKKFAAVLEDRILFLDRLVLTTSQGEKIYVGIDDTYAVKASAAKQSAALKIASAALGRGQQTVFYGETFELVFTAQSEAELTEVTLFISSTYADGLELTEELALTETGFTQSRQGDLVSVRVPMHVPNLPEAAVALRFESLYARNAGLQDVYAELPEKPALKLSRLR